MPLDPELSQRILAAVEEGFAEQIAFTQELVRFPSLRGQEHTIQDYVFRALRERGYAMERFAMDRNAIERHPGGAPSRKSIPKLRSSSASIGRRRIWGARSSCRPTSTSSRQGQKQCGRGRPSHRTSRAIGSMAVAGPT